MNSISPFEKAKRYIETHSSDAGNLKVISKLGINPCITISRQTGAGADKVANELINFFQPHLKEDLPEWTIFDHNLIKKVLEDHNLPLTLSKIMEEEKYSAIKSIANELLGGRPTSWTLVHKTTETILQLAHIGNVIIVGRGANIITSALKNSFHIRLISTIEDRVKHTMEVYKLKEAEAVNFIGKDDEARKDYLKTYFSKDIDDPLLYHMIINTHLISPKEAAELIGHSVMLRFPNEFDI